MEEFACEVWEALGRHLDWAGLAMLIEVHDLTDPEALIANLLTLNALTPKATLP